ncbi:unnamed protein product [Nesidiocoris tenuis]|uniref:Uncharacterized protein n=1 Tax=Nesidiocoris tenuis TaxID=355587 RepID=A0A6H5HKW6_9HEMI|nr:unnamed protein product [Nesidiocoris tenuis]
MRHPSADSRIQWECDLCLCRSRSVSASRSQPTGSISKARISNRRAATRRRFCTRSASALDQTCAKAKFAIINGSFVIVVKSRVGEKKRLIILFFTQNHFLIKDLCCWKYRNRQMIENPNGDSDIIFTRTLLLGIPSWKLSVRPTEAQYNVNSSSIRRARMKYRATYANNLKRAFNPEEIPLTIHWDGKMLEDITGHETVDRLPILASGNNVDQLLAVPKLASGTGESIASAVFETLLQWDLLSKARGMSFDTTSSNTGRLNGACTLLEQKLNREPACRHHILEIMLEAVVLKSLGPSSGPDILLFVRFRKAWPSLNKEGFKVADDPILQKIGSRNVELVLSFAEKQLDVFQPRDDYKELLTLVIMFLGGIPKNGINFMAPAGLHRARWMAKGIYAIKVYMFRGEFKMTKKEEVAITELCMFVVSIYVYHWFQAPSCRFAPRNDLKLLKDLKAYNKMNEAIAEVALKKFSGHLWYLSGVLVAFAFFDENVPLETKTKMVQALENEGQEDTLRRITIDSRVIEMSSLEDFVSQNTRKFFSITGLSPDLLEREVVTWESDPEYLHIKNIVSSMRVVNDIAERGVALMEEYNKLHTQNEEQKQYLLLTVKEFRKKFPDSRKSTLLK